MSDQVPATILVVEDHALVRWTAVEILEEAGFRTIEAKDAASAIAILKERANEVTVLFTDIDMPPGIDGVELTREVHERWPNLLLLVTSGRVQMDEADLPDDGRFLAKPYLEEAVIKKVREMLKTKA